MEDIDLKDLIQMFFEKKFLIIFIVIIFSILGAFYTLKVVTPMYESSTSLVLVQTNNDGSAEVSNSITTSDITLNSNLVDDYTEIAKSKVVASTVIKNLKLNTDIEELQESISVTSISNTELIKITVEDTNPQNACKIANEVAKVFIEKVNEIYKVSNVHVLDVAEVEDEPSNINLVKNVIIFAFVGGVFVAGYILLVNMLDTTVKNDSDIEKALGIPVLASIVLTEENSRKKEKKSKNKETKVPFSNNVQFFYENDIIDHNDKIDFLSYTDNDKTISNKED